MEDALEKKEKERKERNGATKTFVGTHRKFAGFTPAAAKRKTTSLVKRHCTGRSTAAMAVFFVNMLYVCILTKKKK